MAFDGREVANFILDRCADSRREVTPLALQKIMYFCHGWALIKLRRPLVKHAFEAWEFGPVLPYLYRDFKSYEDRPITSRAFGLNLSTGERAVVKYSFDPDMQILLEGVVNFYSRLPASDLVRMSHLQGSPWYRVWNHAGKCNPGMRIDDSEIVQFYSSVEAPFLLEYGTYQ